MKLKYHKFTLSNGIRVFMVPKKETKAVHIEIMIKVGSRYETDDVRGIAHFIEHMVFKGTKKRPTYVQINKEVDQYGGTYNAYTGLDITGYWVKLPAEQFELGVDLLSDILINPKFNEKELKKEKGVILEEIKMKHDSPEIFGWLKFHELVFGNTSLGKSVLGTEETIKKMSRKKLIHFKSQFYKTNNMVIAIGGNIKTKEAKRIVEKYFNKIKGTAEDNYERNIISQNSPIVKIYKRSDIKQAKLTLGFRSFGRDGDDQDRTIRSLLSSILGGYTSSKLHSEIREKRGLCYNIYASTDVFDETGIFEIGGGFDVNKTPEALGAILKILRDIKTKGVEGKEIKMGKNNKIGRLKLSLEGASGWASNIADMALYEKHIELPEKTIQRIKKVTNSDLKRLAREIFRPENFNMVIVGPIDPKEEKKYLDLIKL